MLGQINKVDLREALSFIAGYRWMKSIAIGASADENVDLYTVIGAGAVGCDVFNTTGATGNIIVGKTIDDYVTIPVQAYSRTGLIGRFRYIKKTGSIATAVILYQEINQ
jgi:hypothetical protein